MKDRECRTCQYARLKYERETPGTPTQCHRYPPVVIDPEYPDESYFPVVSPYEWCGEWKPKENKPATVDKTVNEILTEHQKLLDEDIL